MDVQTRFLRYFLAVAEARSFSRAAAKLGVSQPALSQRIQDLEALFELPLFERAGRGIALTPQGQALIPSVRNLLSHVKQFEGEITDLRTNAMTPMLMGVTMYSDYPERSELIARFLEAYPEERIELETGYTLALYEGLLAGEFDFAIVIGPPADERFDVIFLRWFEPYALVPATSPLARQETIYPEHLSTESIACFRRKRHPWLFDELIQPFAQAGATVHYAPDQTPAGALAFAAQAGMSIVAAFPMHSDELVKDYNMVRRKLGGLGSIAAIQLVRARGLSTVRSDRFWNFAAALDCFDATMPQSRLVN